MDCMVYGVANSWAWLSNVHFPSPGDFPNPGMEPRSFLSFNFTTRQVQKWLLFLFRSSCFILSGAITNCPPLFPDSILDTFYLGVFIIWRHNFLPFHIVHGVFAARILVCIPSSCRPHFVRTLHYDPSILGGPARHGSWLYWVMQAPSPLQWRVMEKLKGTQSETKDLFSTPIPGLYPHHTWSQASCSLNAYHLVNIIFGFTEKQVTFSSLLPKIFLWFW